MPAWDPSVETWDVMDNGKVIGRFYLDMFPRRRQVQPPADVTGAGRRSRQAVAGGDPGLQLPAADAPTIPGLMDYGDVVTFFHEFGHLMHHILGGQQQWAGISGISMEADFVEAPSQMLEEWMRSPQVLATFAQQLQDRRTHSRRPGGAHESGCRLRPRQQDQPAERVRSHLLRLFTKASRRRPIWTRLPLDNFTRYTLLKPIAS